MLLEHCKLQNNKIILISICGAKIQNVWGIIFKIKLYIDSYKKTFLFCSVKINSKFMNDVKPHYKQNKSNYKKIILNLQI